MAQTNGTATNGVATNGITTNGVHQPVLAPGVFVPICTFFHAGTEEVDLDLTTKHAVRMASAGLGLVATGSMGEAHNLTHAERNSVVAAVRKGLDEASLDVPLIAGTGAGSTKETIELSKDAKAAGATHVMVILSGYFKGALDAESIRDFFVDVAKDSPLPVIIYNYPGACAGIDLDSDQIEEIANLAPNICGVKLTCGSVGKLSRLTNIERKDFSVLGGYADFLLPSLLLKGNGCITGLANVAPKSVVHLYRLSLKALAAGPASSEIQDAVHVQTLVSHGDNIMAKAGISGTKYALELLHGYGGVPRRPLQSYKGDGKKLMASMFELLELEKSL